MTTALLVALTAMLAFSAGMLVGATWAGDYHGRHDRRALGPRTRRDEWPGS